MTWLFIRFYLCVLVVLALAWYIHSAVLKSRADAEWERVIVEAHGGGARLVASELDASLPESREQILSDLREQFDFPLGAVLLTELPTDVQRRIARGDDVACYRLEERYYVVAVLSGDAEAVRLGPFPKYDLQEIEESIGGWMRVPADKLNAAAIDKRQELLDELNTQFAFPVDIADRGELPDWPQGRIVGGEDIVFYSPDARPDDQWFAATPLSGETEVVRFGPFPNFERVEQKAATTTLALVLLPAALVIALLLRPVASAFELSEMVSRSGGAIFADRTSFQRAMGNLLSNAGRHARRQVTVDAVCGNELVTLDIDDDGLGIPECDRARVFEPFQRLDDGTNGHGVGLGLALVKRIVTQHGGRVEVLTSPLGGCRIRTTWPIGELDAGRG